MGIHGEPGREYRLLPAKNTATEVAQVLIDGVLARLPSQSNSNREEIAVLINNLGEFPQHLWQIIKTLSALHDFRIQIRWIASNGDGHHDQVIH